MTKTRLNLHVDRARLAEFKAACARRGVTMTEVISTLMDDFVVGSQALDGFGEARKIREARDHAKQG